MKTVLSFCTGPFALKGRKNKFIGLCTTLFLTLTTQVGGLVLWPFWSWTFGRFQNPSKSYRLKRIGTLTLIYTVFSLLILPLIANQTGRKRLPLYATKELPTGPQSILFPLLNRTYVRKHTYDVFIKAVQETAQKHPGTIIRYLDAGFPFPYIHLLPHLSHVDGQKIDVAFLFQKEGVYIDKARSPIGYWGYAKETSDQCVGHKSKYIIPLRWDFDWLQPLLPDLDLDVAKNRTLFKALAKDKKTCGILLEPPLHKLLKSSKLKSNSCNVARHDDHFHLDIRLTCP